MKLHTDRIDIERSGVDTETEFKIKTTSKAFDILSTGLYTDNILAVVRELSCNAYDAHVAANRSEIPFEIHLPNRLEPYFSVKDFGVGLSDSQVMSLYTTYFDSTKTDSNDFIGALGLGSKSPFSYTKAFEVISRFNGYRRVYSVFINEHGVPTIAQLGLPLATDEHNGLEVKLTVQAEDFSKFSNTVSSALMWFPTKPVVTGAADFNFKSPPDTNMKGDGWYIHNRHNGHMAAVQGNVEYRVDVSQIDDISAEAKTFIQCVGVIAFFEIGELEVAASREEIRYDKRSKKALASKVEEIYQSAISVIEELADNIQGGMWNTIVELNKISISMMGHSNSLRHIIQNTKHPVLKQYLDSFGTVSIPPSKLNAHDVYTYKKKPFSGFTLKRETVNGVVSPNLSTEVFFDDVTVGRVKRLRGYMDKSSTCSSVLVISRVKNPTRTERDENDNLVSVLLTNKEIEDEYREIIQHLGDPSVRSILNDTPSIVSPPRKVQSRTTVGYTFDGLRYRTYSNAGLDWNRVQNIDLESGGMYFHLDNGRHLTWREKHLNWRSGKLRDTLLCSIDLVNEHLGLHGDSRYSTRNVYGIGNTHLQKFVKHKKWVNLFDVVEQALKQHHHSMCMLDGWKAVPDSVQMVKDAIIHDNDFRDKVISKVPTKSEFRTIVDTLHSWFEHKKSIPSRVVELHLLCQTFELHSSSNDYVVDDTSLNKYPMLKYVADLTSRDVDLNEVLDYINLIDNRSE